MAGFKEHQHSRNSQTLSWVLGGSIHSDKKTQFQWNQLLQLAHSKPSPSPHLIEKWQAKNQTQTVFDPQRLRLQKLLILQACLLWKKNHIHQDQSSIDSIVNSILTHFLNESPLIWIESCLLDHRYRPFRADFGTRVNPIFYTEISLLESLVELDTLGFQSHALDLLRTQWILFLNENPTAFNNHQVWGDIREVCLYHRIQWWNHAHIQWSLDAWNLPDWQPRSWTCMPIDHQEFQLNRYRQAHPTTLFRYFPNLQWDPIPAIADSLFWIIDPHISAQLASSSPLKIARHNELLIDLQSEIETFFNKPVITLLFASLFSIHHSLENQHPSFLSGASDQPRNSILSILEAPIKSLFSSHRSPSLTPIFQKYSYSKIFQELLAISEKNCTPNLQPYVHWIQQTQYSQSLQAHLSSKTDFHTEASIGLKRL